MVVVFITRRRVFGSVIILPPFFLSMLSGLIGRVGIAMTILSLFRIPVRTAILPTAIIVFMPLVIISFAILFLVIILILVLLVLRGSTFFFRLDWLFLHQTSWIIIGLSNLNTFGNIFIVVVLVALVDSATLTTAVATGTAIIAVALTTTTTATATTATHRNTDPPLGLIRFLLHDAQAIHGIVVLHPCFSEQNPPMRFGYGLRGSGVGYHYEDCFLIMMFVITVRGTVERNGMIEHSIGIAVIVGLVLMIVVVAAVVIALLIDVVIAPIFLISIALPLFPVLRHLALQRLPRHDPIRPLPITPFDEHKVVKLQRFNGFEDPLPLFPLFFLRFVLFRWR
mmetsp:Transcript_28224/g.57009  ORF Transcript_28224/g.57009 Transcript_28224/m.57009 type:complete len:339 (-) Transcript_28224:1633-2649(-)